MEQRPLRLGDILDDYCPRERRVTNHAIVAMVADDVKQTRCTTCDTEHLYKGGKAPRRRKGESTARLYKEVLAGIESEGTPVNAQSSNGPSHEAEPEPEAEYTEEHGEKAPPQATRVADEPETEPEPEPEPGDEGPVHRPLIRATLPRPEGVKVERQIPDFTIRHNGRGPTGGFRDARGGGGRNGGAAYGRFGRGQGRPGGGAGGRGQGRGAAQGFGRPGGGQRHGGPKKRSR